MRISARTQYALRAMVALAAGDGPLAAGKISADQDIPRRFCDNILLHLRRAGLIQSARGPEGGYWLARSPEQISVADVIRVTEGVEPPPQFPGVSGPLTEILEKVRDREQAQLREITLAAVVASSRPPAPWRPPAPRPSE